ncbi:MAG: TIGR03619 family F420-dependent LLM class oxidoreductase [Pseudomonadota bacterium]|nr:TIGR03619 family F420-dependent LLM class oxidoreductase [Pseudomonadota bacterium]
MDFGLHVGTRRVGASPNGLQAIAIKAEALGYSYLGFPDHVIIPNQVDSKYPYNKEGLWPAQDTGTCLEQLMTLAYISAVTTNINLLTSVLVLPHRSPVLAAKMLATADVLSKGRLAIGLGIGWMAEEIAILSAVPFKQRALAANEQISAFIELWTEAKPSFHGQFVNFENILFDPKPIQKPYPPLWMGGESVPAMNRAAKFADCWYPVIANAKNKIDSAERYGTALATLQKKVRVENNSQKTLDTALYASWYQMGEPLWDADGKRKPFTGNATQIAEDAIDYAKAGLNHLIIGFESDDIDVWLYRIEKFAAEVMPLVRKNS